MHTAVGRCQKFPTVETPLTFPRIFQFPSHCNSRYLLFLFWFLSVRYEGKCSLVGVKPQTEHLFSLHSSPPAKGHHSTAVHCVCVSEYSTLLCLMFFLSASACMYLFERVRVHIILGGVLFTFPCSRQQKREHLFALSLILISIPPTVPLIQPSLNWHQCNRIKVSSHHLHFLLLEWIQVMIIIMLMCVRTTNTKHSMDVFRCT